MCRKVRRCINRPSFYGLAFTRQFIHCYKPIIMSKPLFFFSQMNALDTVPIHHITAVEIFGDTAKFKLVDDEGQRSEKLKPLTRFVFNQIEQYGLEKYES